VNQLTVVEGIQSFGDPAGDVDGLGHLETPMLGERLQERRPWDIFHDQIGQPIEFTEIAHPNHGIMSDE
jgi:hypothetical protein